MSSECPSCGYIEFNPSETCICGYHADNSFIIESVATQSERTDKEKVKAEVPRNTAHLKTKNSSEDIVIKEIASWIFTFSQQDKCLYLGTPALQSFRLKLNLNDLEELLDIMYQKTGTEKTTRKLRLSADKIPDVINRIYRMVEEKKSKISLKFDSDELQEIGDLINTRLKE